MRTSPFVKTNSDKDVHFLVKKSKEAATNAHYAVTSIFPNSGDVPHSIRLYSALFYLAAVAAVFIYLLYTGYESALHQQFLAPYLGNNALADSNCQLIPISYTGNFLVSDGGYWEGSNKFSYNTATFNLAMTAYSATSEGYVSDLKDVYKGLQMYGELAKTQALDQNLLLWMSMVFVNQSSSAKRITMTGDPLVVFNRDHTEAAVSSILGNCNVSSDASFDNSNGMLSVSFVYADFIKEPKCMKAMDPVHFGYNTLTAPKMFELSFDIRTIISGLAVNMGILKPDQLEEITKYRQNLIVNGNSVVARYYYDPRYAGMQPLRCVSVSGASPFCTFRVNDVVMFPVFHHMGGNLTYPQECDCKTLSVAELSDKTHNCNVFRFLSGFLFFSGTYSASANYALGLLNTKLGGDLQAVNEGAHRAMFIASSYGQNSPLAEELNSPASLADAYEFCTFAGMSCSFLTFSSYDITATSWAVSNYYTLVTNGACVNTITPTPEAWDQLQQVPYGPLVQSYQQCSNDKYQTMLNQAGIAVGNLQVFAPICVIFLMLVTYMHKWWNRVPLDESYTKAEKDSALDAFSMSLLLARDEKLKTQSFRGNNSIIALIAEELGEHTFLSNVSHKSHATNYSMSSMSIHSASGGESPTSKIYAKISSLGTRVRSGSASSQVQVVPIDDDVELKFTTASASDLKLASLETSSRKKQLTHEQQLEGKTQWVEATMRKGRQGSASSPERPETNSLPPALQIPSAQHVSYEEEQAMSMREWIVAKKRGSLGDDGEGLHYARRGSINDSNGHHHRGNRDSADFSYALGRVNDMNVGRVIELGASFAQGNSDKV